MSKKTFRFDEKSGVFVPTDIEKATYAEQIAAEAEVERVKRERERVGQYL